ncbi:MAG: DNA cytosine methyltransferase [Kiritimatiellaeota bacterium]|nr:DNA cytosine methyltransferase [Kiritimatiellota bacterium]
MSTRKYAPNGLPPERPPQAHGYTLLSLFSGAGGLDIGFEKAGFKTVWANEYDKAIAPSYQKYFPGVSFDGRSISDVPDDELPANVQGVIGGPPCQSWSEAGARRGINDRRGQLFFEYLRVIRKAQPKFFVAENVHGMIHSRNEKSFRQIVSLFAKEGYTVVWRLLKASDYGVPQDRERVFIVGYHRSLGKRFEFPAPIGTKVSLRDAIHDLAKIPPGKSKGKIKNHELHESGYSPIFLSRNRVRGWDEQSFTILAADRHIPFHPQAPKMPRSPDGGRMLAPGHEHTYRRLTIRECARIQTFPDDYEFIYTNIRHGYKMIGNAVPVNLAYHVAKTIFADMKMCLRFDGGWGDEMTGQQDNGLRDDGVV